MNNKLLTVLIACEKSTDDIQKTIDSFDNVSVETIAFLIGDYSALESEQMLRYATVFEGYRAQLDKVKTPYVQFCLAGDTIVRSKNTADFFYNLLDAETDILVLDPMYKLSAINANSVCEILNLAEKPERVPKTLRNLIIKTELARTCYFDMEAKYDQEQYLLYQLIGCVSNVTLIKNIGFYFSTPAVRDFIRFPLSQEKGWYGETIEQIYVKLGQQFIQKRGSVPQTVQYGFYYELLMRFAHNLNSRNKYVYDKGLEEFQVICRELLTMIDDSIILNLHKYQTKSVSDELKLHLLKLKYGHDIFLQYIVDDKTEEVSLSYQGIVFKEGSAQKIVVDALKAEADGLVLEASFMEFTPREDYRLCAYLNEKELPLLDTKRYAQIEYFGVPVRNKRTFMVKVPWDMISNGAKLRFYAYFQNIKLAMTYEAGRFPARITTKMKKSYWKVHGLLLNYTDKTKALQFCKATGKKHLRYELRYLKEILHVNKRALVLRGLYWLTYPYFKNKRIWLTFDKMYKTGDNGDYFYRYALKQKDGIIKKYVANKGYPDTIQMQKEGLKPLLFATWKQRLYFLNASIIAATHANIPVFSGTAPAKFMYTQDLFRGEVVCIQHGLAVQQLAHNLNSQYDNTRKFYCASPYEIKNLSQDAYGYYDKKDLELVGLARYDGLVNNDQRQILITPTWRAYISMPVSIGNTRPYSEDFKETVYYKVFSSLITNPKLVETAKRCNYRIVYLLHPVISSQIDDFKPLEGVEVKSPVGVNYEKILTESSLMVTDYSGVQFDFAYMRKPVIYYHTPKLPPHYEEGGFFYDSMGFGEICEDETVLVDTLCEYMERECQMKEFYRNRADEFFAFSDHNNCERIYQAIKTFDEECHGE